MCYTVAKISVPVPNRYSIAHNHQRRIGRQPREQRENRFRGRQTSPEPGVSHALRAALGETVGGVLPIVSDQRYKGIRQEHVARESKYVLLFFVGVFGVGGFCSRYIVNRHYSLEKLTRLQHLQTLLYVASCITLHTVLTPSRSYCFFQNLPVLRTFQTGVLIDVWGQVERLKRHRQGKTWSLFTYFESLVQSRTGDVFGGPDQQNEDPFLNQCDMLTIPVDHPLALGANTGVRGFSLMCVCVQFKRVQITRSFDTTNSP